MSNLENEANKLKSEVTQTATKVESTVLGTLASHWEWLAVAVAVLALGLIAAVAF